MVRLFLLIKIKNKMEQTVETQETTEDLSTEKPSEETQETSGSSLIEQIFPDLNPATEADKETQEASETEGGEQTNDEPETETGNVIEIVVEGQSEKFDLTKDEEKTKLIEFAQKGRHYERRMHEVKEKENSFSERERLLNQLGTAASFSYLKNVAQGELILNEPDRDAYLDDLNYQSREEAIEAYNKDKVAYREQMRLLDGYNSMTQTAYTEYVNQKEAFLKKHPEITNFDEWAKDNVNKYIEPITTFGAKPLPNDFFEMIQYWNNRNKNEETIRQDERKKIATAKPTVKPTVTKVNKDPLANTGDTWLNALAPKDNRKLIAN